MRYILAVALILMPCLARAASYTSAGTGNWADDATWAGSGVPGDGDIAIIATGHTVTVAADVTVGSNSSNVGDAIEIQATDATTFGKLIVNDAVTLTLKGNDATSNTAMEIDRYAVFEPAPGAIIQVDTAANYETVIANSGIINAIGTVSKPITFRATGSGINWNNSSSSESKTGANWQYDSARNLATRSTTNPWIANSGGTALGSSADTSVSITSPTPGTICATEVSSLAAVDAVGEYFVNYHNGIIYFYHVHSAGSPSFTVNYKYLSFNGWGIQTRADTTYNEGKFEYCTFEYMGGTSAREYGLDNRYKKSATVAANRLFKLVNCTVSYCRQFCAMREFTGSSGDEIKVTGNTFNHCVTSTYAHVLGFNETTANSYIDIENNTLNCQSFLYVGSPYETTAQHVGISISNNTGVCQSVLQMRSASTYSELYDGVISGNTLEGLGRLLDLRCFSEIAGSASHPLVIEGNTFGYGNRFASGVQSYVTFRKNIIHSFPHHWFTAPLVEEVISQDVLVENNLFFCTSAGDTSSVFETGYNHRGHLHNWRFINNTIGRGCYGMLSLGDTADAGTQSLVTKLVVANNIAYQPTYGIVRNTNDADELNLFHIEYLDGNLVYNPSTGQVSGINGQATPQLSGANYNTASRNVTGAALFDPLYSLPEATNRSLVFTYTSATDQTLAWGGGTAVQLVVDDGTATAGANVSSRYGTLTDSGASWSTTLNSGTVVRCKWVKITGGTGSGQIRAITNNTATVLSVVPSWTTPPSTDSTYTIIESEVQLFDSGATNYVRAGIYLPDLPTSTQTDSNITWLTTSLTTDPDLVDPTLSTAAAHQIQAGSPAIDVGNATYAPATDYYGTARPQGSADDLGFFEYAAGGSAIPVIFHNSQLHR